MTIALFSSYGIDFLLRWIHFLSGITWIGLLYYFNFVQGEWFKEADAGVKSAAIQKLVPRALAWFRYSALVTFLSGAIIILLRAHDAGWGVFANSWGILILIGATLGTLMFLNVWLIIWPNQKIVIASARQVAAGGQADPRAVAAGARAGVASRTNVLFSIPMLFFMGAASHLGIQVAADANFTALKVVIGIILAILEINAIRGKTGPMTTIKGVITYGIILTVVLYGFIEALV